MAAAAVYNIALPLLSYKACDDASAEIAALALTRVTPENDDGAENGETLVSDETSDAQSFADTQQASEPFVLSADFELLASINTDIKAWLISGGTVINYPVLQTSDNEYYLTHMYNRRRNMTGSIFIDAANSPDFSDRHTVIHGHNMKNGSMFASLTNYADEEYFAAHKSLTLLTPDGSYTLYVFSAYVTDVTTGEAYMTSFANGVSFAAYAEELKARSLISADVSVGENDRIVTLSTCIKTNGVSDERFVVHTVLKEN